MKLIFPILFTLVIIAIFHYTQITAVKYYPALVNLFVFMVFFISLFRKETIIQKFAKIIEKKELPDIVKNYTRKLTYVWCGFLLINFIISTATIYMDEKIWTIYNGLISYLLTGCLFGVEYVVRIIFKRKHNV